MAAACAMMLGWPAVCSARLAISVRPGGANRGDRGRGPSSGRGGPGWRRPRRRDRDGSTRSRSGSTGARSRAAQPTVSERRRRERGSSRDGHGRGGAGAAVRARRGARAAPRRRSPPQRLSRWLSAARPSEAPAHYRPKNQTVAMRRLRLGLVVTRKTPAGRLSSALPPAPHPGISGPISCRAGALARGHSRRDYGHAFAPLSPRRLSWPVSGQSGQKGWGLPAYRGGDASRDQSVCNSHPRLVVANERPKRAARKRAPSVLVPDA